MDKYTIIEHIGEGAHGLVLKAHDIAKGREVAIKKVALKKVKDGIPIPIMREVKTLQQLKHPYVRM